MASVCNRSQGKKAIQFSGADGSLKTIYIGKVSRKQANMVKGKVEQLVSASITGHSVDDETARWLAGLDSVLLGKLSKAGLISKRESITLGNLIDQYFQVRTDVKPVTLTVWGHTRRNLLKYFSPDKPLKEITRGDAEDWRVFLAQEKLSEPTIRKRCGFAKQFFNYAVKKELISSNPFSELKSRALSNPDRFYFISREEAEKVIEACPDSQWRLLFALSRFGGLRCPSEHLALKWEDVDWEHNRITITSPKTEHHDGGAYRIIPMFPELRPYLDEAFELAEPGTEYVINRYRDTNSNLRTQLNRIIKRAGLVPWPKLFQNLRSTRQTELIQDHPIHVVCNWIGNSEDIAAKHYLQVTDDDFEKALQNVTQYSAVYSSTESQSKKPAHKKTSIFQEVSTDCIIVRKSEMENRGLEPLTFWLPAKRSPN